MKVLLCYMSFCVIIVASGQSKLQVTMNGPLENCSDVKDNLKIFLTDLKFIQTTDDDFTLNGKYEISETIDGPISTLTKITSKKLERGSWVNSMLNQNIQDLCKEMEKEEHPDWLKLFVDWTANEKCPFIQKVGEFNEFIVFDSKKSGVILPPNFYGKYKTESRFYQTINGQNVEFGCCVVHFELANV